jgi:predicted Ser/Thr protein kinase
MEKDTFQVFLHVGKKKGQVMEKQVKKIVCILRYDNQLNLIQHFVTGERNEKKNHLIKLSFFDEFYAMHKTLLKLDLRPS